MAEVLAVGAQNPGIMSSRYIYRTKQIGKTQTGTGKGVEFMLMSYQFFKMFYAGKFQRYTKARKKKSHLYFSTFYFETCMQL